MRTKMPYKIKNSRDIVHYFWERVRFLERCLRHFVFYRLEMTWECISRDVKFEPTGNALGRAPGPRRAFAGLNVRRAGLVRCSE